MFNMFDMIPKKEVEEFIQSLFPLQMDVEVKKLKPEAKLPEQGSGAAAGYDVFACLDTDEILIDPHTTVKVGTGLALAPPAGTWVGVFARSGLATKQGLRPANCTGVCDEDYRGEYIVAVHNDSDEVQKIENGEKIAQLILLPRLTMKFKEVDELNDTKRGTGGFGSTGRK